jgi:hypothetical protein
MATIELQEKVARACRRLLSEQNLDPYTPTYGCFDRRYWSWKLIDYPEATFQRNVYPLAWLLRQVSGQSNQVSARLTTAVIAGLDYAVRIQHKDGSFDQAFPNEHSFGATAFLLHPLLEAYQVTTAAMSTKQCMDFKVCLRRGADFLCQYDETHGHIANHLAGAVLCLLECANFFNESHYAHRAKTILQTILDHQSREGWYLEYEGADPGYQTLCLHYLAQVYQLSPDERLRNSLTKAVDFLAWFVHPDGTFAGEYGSRRTSIYYPGGLALLQGAIPMARSMTQFMTKSIVENRTITVDTVDIGNLAPLLSSTTLLLDIFKATDMAGFTTPDLPWQRENQICDFSEAGLYVRSTARHYAILGASNGGVLKVFDRQTQVILLNDGGYVGEDKRGLAITTQITELDKKRVATADAVEVECPFFRMLQASPTPFQFILLRLLNLTLMRSLWLGNRVKDMLVRRLISGKHRIPLCLRRKVIFSADYIEIEDRFSVEKPLSLLWLKCGVPFVAIHMASARYFQGFTAEPQQEQLQHVDVSLLATQGYVQIRKVT